MLNEKFDAYWKSKGQLIHTGNPIGYLRVWWLDSRYNNYDPGNYAIATEDFNYNMLYHFPHGPKNLTEKQMLSCLEMKAFL